MKAALDAMGVPETFHALMSQGVPDTFKEVFEKPVEPDPFDRVLYTDELLVQAISDHLLYNPEFLRMCRTMACNATNPNSMGTLICGAVRKRAEDL